MISADLVKHEVEALLAQNPGMSEADCTSQCDALFNLLQDHDETATDNMCAHDCHR